MWRDSTIIPKNIYTDSNSNCFVQDNVVYMEHINLGTIPLIILNDAIIPKDITIEIPDYCIFGAYNPTITY
jgi:hypothetical protein